jgi:uncharacterized membrane protein YoaT (DUF817 family)
MSAHPRWDPRSWLTQRRERLRAWAVRGPATGLLFEFVAFGVKQAWACVFGAALLALLLATHFFYPEGAALARYDFLFLAALGLQALLLLTRLETLEEARVIFAFHVVGTVMELFKTSVGSWVYPEAAWFRLEGVPLFSGFMYASVGSYIARVWRICAFRFEGFPALWRAGVLAFAIYVNFFTHHVFWDLRWLLFAASALVFWRTRVWFRADRAHRAMPLLLGFVLVALFIWLAENIATFANAWTYPEQNGAWRPVKLAKLGSWYLLMIISFVLVAAVHRPNAASALVAQGGARVNTG